MGVFKNENKFNYLELLLLNSERIAKKSMNIYFGSDDKRESKKRISAKLHPLNIEEFRIILILWGISGNSNLIGKKEIRVVINYFNKSGINMNNLPRFLNRLVLLGFLEPFENKYKCTFKLSRLASIYIQQIEYELSEQSGINYLNPKA